MEVGGVWWRFVVVVAVLLVMAMLLMLMMRVVKQKGVGGCVGVDEGCAGLGVGGGGEGSCGGSGGGRGGGGVFHGDVQPLTDDNKNVQLIWRACLMVLCRRRFRYHPLSCRLEVALKVVKRLMQKEELNNTSTSYIACSLCRLCSFMESCVLCLTFLLNCCFLLKTT